MLVSNAQVIEITGKVTDGNKNPIINAIISVKGTDIKANSDENGFYKIKAKDGDVLLVTSITGVSKEVMVGMFSIIIVGGNNVLDIALEGENIYNMSLEELMNIQIISASNVTEKLSEAPATIIVLTAQDLKDRGYIQFSDFMDDLPGMDVVRTYGDTYFKNYWRGYRNTVGAPYLLMVDGMVQNQLWTNTSQIMAALPMSNIKSVEVVYGPASSVYGANAFMGVINVITKKSLGGNGTSVTTNTFSSINNYFTGDYNLFYEKGDLKLSFTGRMENGNVNEFIDNNDFEWTKDKYYADALLWGDVVNNEHLGGSYSSPISNRAIDFRAFYGDFEIGLNLYRLSTGYGSAYPADKVQNANRWPQEEQSIFLKHSKQISEKVNVRTLVRYRNSDITNDGLFIEAYNTTSDTAADPSQLFRVVDFSSWSTYNNSVSFFQDFDLRLHKKISVLAGLKYEYKDLERAYNAVYSDAVYPGDITKASAMYPQITPSVNFYDNRVIMIDKAAYLQAKLNIVANHSINLGTRYDFNSQYGGTPTFRLGYVGNINKINFKALYGQAYQEPTMRNLYGGWGGSGSNENLKPEKSQTAEASLSFLNSKFSSLISAYYVNNTNTIVGDKASAVNLGERNLAGIDLHLRTHLSVSFLDRLNAWVYYSFILLDEEQKFDDSNNVIGTDIIGDLAHHKVYFGITADFAKRFTVNIRGRYIGERQTVSTNPLGSVPAYLTFDGNINVKDLFVKGLGLSLKLVNIADVTYYHPGVREANSGNTPGVWADAMNYQWNGSSGWYNSLLPQPHRFIMLGISLDL